MFKERSFRSRLLFTPFCLKNVVCACLNLYSIVFCVFWFGSVPLSSLFLLYIQRKVLGACQNRYSIVFCVCWFRSRLIFSFMFKGRFLAPVKIVCWFRFLLLFTPFCLKNFLVGCLNLYSIVFFLYLLVRLSSTFLLLFPRTFLAPVKIVLCFLSGLLITPFCLKSVLGGYLILYSIVIIFYLVSFSLFYRQWNVICDSLNLIRSF
jgi:hypothetical protein